MRIVIRRIILVRGYPVLSNGEFPVKERAYKEDPDQAAAKIASKWIDQSKREMDVDGIVKVLYDGEKDITELVKELQKPLL